MHPNPPNAASQPLLADGALEYGKHPGSVLSGLMHLGLLPFLLGIHPAYAGPPAQNALPGGAQFDPSQVNIATTGSQMTITQSVQRAIVNWDSYHIGADAWVDYRQPGTSSVTLNRVLSSDPSRIFGRLTANGQVWLINPAGVLFGPGSSVNVGGLLASSLAITDDDFMNGRNLFIRNGALGSIVNQGQIIAHGNGGDGLIALFAPEVRNAGLLEAHLGTVAMAAGDRVALDSGAEGRLKLSVDPASVDALVENRHLIRADGGQVVMSARALSKLSGAVIQNGGAIEASSLTRRDGVIRLEGNRITATGSLDVSAREKTADGGSITLNADSITTQGILLDAGGGSQGRGGSILYKAQEVSLSGEIRNSTGGVSTIDPATLTLGATVYGAGTFKIDADNSITVTGTQQLAAASTLVFRDETTVNPGSGTGLNIADDLTLNLDTATPFSITPGGVISGLGVRNINISGAGSSVQNSDTFTLANTLLNNQSAGQVNPLDATIRLTGAYAGLSVNAPDLDSLTLAGIDPDGTGGANPLTTSTGVSVTALGTGAALDGRAVKLDLSNLTGPVSLDHDNIGNNETATSSILINNVIATAIDVFNLSGSNRFAGSTRITNSVASNGRILVSGTGDATIAANLVSNSNGTAIRVQNMTGNVDVDSNIIGGASDGAGIVVEGVSGNVTMTDNDINNVRDTGPGTDFGFNGIALDGRSIYVSAVNGKVRIGGDNVFADAGIGATLGNGGGNYSTTGTDVARNFIVIRQSGDGSSDAVVIRNNFDPDGGAAARSVGGEGNIYVDRALGGVRVEANALIENVNAPAIHIRGAADGTAAPVTASVVVDSNFILQAQEGTGIVVDRVGGAVTISDNEIGSVANTGASNQFSLGGIRLNGNGIFVAGAGGKVRIGGDAALGDSGAGATIGNGGGNQAVNNGLITPERFIYISQSGDGSSDAVVVRNNADLDNVAVTGRNTAGEGILYIDRAQGGVMVQANSLLETAHGNAIYIRGASDALSAPVTSDVIVEANLVTGATDGAGIAVDRVSGDVTISDNRIGQIGNPTGTNRLSLGGIVLDGISILVAGAQGKLRIGGDVAFGGAGVGASLNHGGGNQVTSGMDSAEGIRLQAAGDGTADTVFIGNNEVTTSGGVFRNAAAINVIDLNGGGEIAANDFLNSETGLRFENLDSDAGLPMLVRNNRFGGIPGPTGTGVLVVDSRVGGLAIRGNGFLNDSGSVVSRAIDIDAASTGILDAGFNYWGTPTSADPSAEILALLNRINDPAKVSITSVVISATAGGIDLDNGAIGNTLTNGALANVAGYQVDGRQLIVLPDELSASTAGLPNRVQSGLDRIAASVAAANATNILQPGAIAAVDPRLVLLNGTYSGGNAVATDANLDGIRFFFENTDDSGAPLLAGGPLLSQGGFTLGAINASFEEGRLTARDAINFNAGSSLTLNDSLGEVRLTSTTGAVHFNGTVNGTGNALFITGTGITQGIAGNIDLGNGQMTLDANDAAVTLAGSITTSNATTGAIRIIDAAATTLNNVSAINGTITLGEAGANALGSVTLNGATTAAGLTIVTGNGSGSGNISNHGKMTVSNDIAASIAGNFLNSATGDIDPVNINLTLSGGSVTNNGAIASDTLSISGAGDFTNSAGGSITLSNDLLAAISGNFSNAGTIHAADRIRVVSAGGSALLSGAGTITAGGAGGGDATPLVLAFSNGSFTNTAGTNAISAANDRWLVYVRSFQPGSFTPGGIETQGAANAGAGGVRTSFYARTYAGTDEAGINALETALGLNRGSRFVFADSPAPPLPPVPPFVNPPAPCQNTGGCDANDGNNGGGGAIAGLPGDALFCSPGAASAGTAASGEDCWKLDSNGWHPCEASQDDSK